MKKTPYILFPAILSLLLFSCKTNEKPEVYTPVNITEESALLSEIDSIRELSKTNVIKALWRAKLLQNTLSENENVLTLYEDCEKLALEEYKNSSGEKKYFQSLKTVGHEFSKEEMQVLPASENSFYTTKSSHTSLSELIKGTVTVFVDKGMKIEHGMGLPDAVLGSGFFISKEGYIVTNHHVISDLVDPKYEGYSRLYIRLAEDPDTRIPAKVIGWDSVLDLALLKAEVDAPIVFALGSSQDLNVGDRVYAIGSPLGLDRTLTSGIISATDRRLFTAGVVFQIDAAVNSGNSGGPLIDEKGRVQAVVFAGVQNYQGLNFAIPVEYLKNELEFLYAGGEREHPWIGAYGKTKREPGSGMKNEGLLVQYVLPGGSANLSGLEKDMTITSLNGAKITSIDDFQFYAMQLSSGTIVNVGAVNPLGKESSHLVYLEKRPDNPGYQVYRHDLIQDALVPLVGMRLVPSSTSNRKHYNVVEVLKASAADEAGFSVNDPVDVLAFEVDDKQTYAQIALYARKKKNGYLDAPMGLTLPLDSPFYF